MAKDVDATEQSNEPADGIEVVETVEVIESVTVTEGDPTDTAVIDSALARAEESLDAAEHAGEPSTEAESDAAGLIAAAAAVPAAALPAAAATVAAPAVAPAPGFAPIPQTVYVQAPVPPKTKSNRGFAVAVGAIGAGIFAALYLGAAWLYLAANDRSEALLSFIESPVFYLPVVVFFVGFALLGASLNRAGWWAWAVFGLLLGIFVYFGTIAAELLVVQAWTLTPATAAEFLRQRWLDPYVIFAALIAREIPVWLGAWIAKNGRKVTQRNADALEEYEQALAAGPIV